MGLYNLPKGLQAYSPALTPGNKLLNANNPVITACSPVLVTNNKPLDASKTPIEWDEALFSAELNPLKAVPPPRVEDGERLDYFLGKEQTVIETWGGSVALIKGNLYTEPFTDEEHLDFLCRQLRLNKKPYAVVLETGRVKDDVGVSTLCSRYVVYVDAYADGAALKHGQSKMKQKNKLISGDALYLVDCGSGLSNKRLAQQRDSARRRKEKLKTGENEVRAYKQKEV